MNKHILIIFLFFASALAVNAQTGIPVYSFWNAKIHRHFYTINPGEVTSAEGWAPDNPSILCYLLTSPVNSTGNSAIRRYNNPSTGAHYYTLTNNAPAGFVFESILGYEPGVPLINTGVPIYEYYNAGDFYYTKNGNGVAGYKLDGLAFYGD